MAKKGIDQKIKYDIINSLWKALCEYAAHDGKTSVWQEREFFVCAAAVKVPGETFTLWRWREAGRERLFFHVSAYFHDEPLMGKLIPSPLRFRSQITQNIHISQEEEK